MGLFYLDEDIDQENKILTEHNPYDWVECNVTMPQMQLVTESANAWEKGIALGILGPVGLVLTSGVNQRYENVSYNSYIKIAEKGVVILQGCDDGSDLRLPWECGVSPEDEGW